MLHFISCSHGGEALFIFTPQCRQETRVIKRKVKWFMAHVSSCKGSLKGTNGVCVFHRAGCCRHQADRMSRNGKAFFGFQRKFVSVRK